MEDLTITTEMWGNLIRASNSNGELYIALDKSAAQLTPSEARTLGQWLIKSSEEQ